MLDVSLSLVLFLSPSYRLVPQGRGGRTSGQDVVEELRKKNFNENANVDSTPNELVRIYLKTSLRLRYMYVAPSGV